MAQMVLVEIRLTLELQELALEFSFAAAYLLEADASVYALVW